LDETIHANFVNRSSQNRMTKDNNIIVILIILFGIIIYLTTAENTRNVDERMKTDPYGTQK
jgi:uncharacterized membrane protein YidH (DUF202 family)